MKIEQTPNKAMRRVIRRLFELVHIVRTTPKTQLREDDFFILKAIGSQFRYQDERQKARIARRCGLKKFEGVLPAQKRMFDCDIASPWLMKNAYLDSKRNDMLGRGDIESARNAIHNNLKRAR